MAGSSSSRPHLVLIGAGMTGRGQVAQLAHDAGWRLTLVDKDVEILGALRRAGQYTVRLLGDGARDVVVTDFDTVDVSDARALAEAVLAADLVVTSVLEPNLADVGRSLARALGERLASNEPAPLNVIAAENMNNSSTVLRGHVRAHMEPMLLESLDRHVAFPDSMIARVVPVARDPLLITAEAFSEWTADRTAAIGTLPGLPGLEWVANQTARLQRKLYIHNTGHAVCGYLGRLAGYRYIHEAAQDPEIMERLTAAISESGSAIAAEHGFDRASVRAYEDNLKGRLVIDALPDDILRVIRQPIRKLGMEERLVGPLLLCEKHGLPIDALCFGIAAVLQSRVDGDEQFERMARAVESLGPVGAVQELVAWTPSVQAARAVTGSFAELSRAT